MDCIIFLELNRVYLDFFSSWFETEILFLPLEKMFEPLGIKSACLSVYLSIHRSYEKMEPKNTEDVKYLEMWHIYYEAWIFPPLTKTFKIKEIAIFIAKNHLRKLLDFPNIQFSSGARGHPFSTYAKFSEKPLFLTPWYARGRVRIKGYEMLVFPNILLTY